MCLIVFAWKTHRQHALVLAANRDEFYERPTQTARFWNDAPRLLAGRDLQAGGTWLGVTRQGRFAAITNFREPHAPPRGAASRGALVSDYLLGDQEPEHWVHDLGSHAEDFAGFNLLVGTPEKLLYFSNRNGRPVVLESGVYALSNHLLDTPWPKAVKAKEGLSERIAQNRLDISALSEVMMDQTLPCDSKLPDTGIGLPLERRLGPVFIESPGYGTRCLTVLTLDRRAGVCFTEQTTAPVKNGTLTYRFSIARQPLSPG